MKKVVLLLCLVFGLSVGFSQKGGGSNSQETAQGLVNGCNDALSSQPNYAYSTIMNNPSLSSTYKAAYQTGWGKCRGGGWGVKNGKLVPANKCPAGQKWDGNRCKTDTSPGKGVE